VRRVAAHVFVADPASPVLAEEDFHHLARVLRLRAGEVVSACDGLGAWRLCEWTGSRELSPAGEVAWEARPAPVLTVAFALTKGDNPERAVQKLTEAGVDRLVVLTSARCVVRWDPARAERQLARLRAVAREAAMQSRRAWLPSVEGPVPFAALVASAEVSAAARDVAGGVEAAAGGLGSGAGGLAGGAGTGSVAIAVLGGAPLSLATPTVLVGPEGGWSDDELAAVPAKVGLGPHVLRAETAATAAGVLLAAMRAGLAAPAQVC
jgi:16S rRNA (uracil1498-N3)-methyltransferase